MSANWVKRVTADKTTTGTYIDDRGNAHMYVKGAYQQTTTSHQTSAVKQTTSVIRPIQPRGK